MECLSIKALWISVIIIATKTLLSSSWGLFWEALSFQHLTLQLFAMISRGNFQNILRFIVPQVQQLHVATRIGFLPVKYLVLAISHLDFQYN